jgi:hypothetical protein
MSIEHHITQNNDNQHNYIQYNNKNMTLCNDTRHNKCHLCCVVFLLHTESLYAHYYNKNMTQHNDSQFSKCHLCFVVFYYYSGCSYAQDYYAECNYSKFTI